VTCDPTHVASRSNLVARMRIKDVFGRSTRADEISCRGVHNTLGFPGGTRRVEEEKRVLRIKDLGRADGALFLDFLMPPEITAFGPGDLGAGTTENDAIADLGTFLERIVDDLLGADRFSASTTFVGGQDNAGICIVDSVAERFRGETGKDDRMESTETNNCEEGNDGFGDHGHVNCDGITLFDAQLLEDIGQFADFTVQFAIGDISALIGFIGFVNNRNLRGLARVCGSRVDTLSGFLRA
jgi:hypothetical protein